MRHGPDWIPASAGTRGLTELRDFHIPYLALGRAAEALDEVERVKANRFRSVLDQRRFIWRRYLRRHLLAQALGAEPRELVFATLCPKCGSCEHGKPYLPHAPHIHFSAAQSGEHTTVAIGPAPLGIDIQIPSPDLRDAADVFTPGEQVELVGATLEEEDRRRATLWARKEAYMKALGLGLAIDPASVDARASGFEDGAFGLIDAPGQTVWSVASWTLSDAAIAIACPTPLPVRLAEIVATADPQTGRLVITTAKAGGHEGETGLIYASSGARGGSGLSRGR